MAGFKGKCFVKNCKNTLRCGKKYDEKLDKKVTYHRFAKNKQRRQQWAKALQLSEDEVTDNHRVCSDHFFEKNFDKSLSRVRLRENAVPFVFHEIVSESNEKANVIESEAKPFSVEIFNKYVEKVIPESNKSTSKRSPSPNYNESTTKHLKTQENEKSMECESKKKFMLVERATSVSPDRNLNEQKFKDRATSVSPERIFHSPTKKRIRENFETQLKKERQERKRVSRKWRRTELKLASMEKVIDKLRRNFFPKVSLRKLKKLENSSKTY